MENLKKSNEESIEAYKVRLENASNSWLLASANWSILCTLWIRREWHEAVDDLRIFGGGHVRSAGHGGACCRRRADRGCATPPSPRSPPAA